MRNNQYLVWLWISLCLGLVLPETLCSSEGKHIRVKHVRDIQGDFNQPSEVAVDGKGRIYVLDGANSKVKIFNKSGKFILAFGQPGNGNGEFNNPVGMDIDEHSNIYIADTGNRRIQIFNKKGIFQKKIDLLPRNVRPVDVKIMNTPDHLYVSDARNHKIIHIENDKVKQSWGNYGELLGEFMFPGMLATDQETDLYVVDILNGRIQIFNPQGKMPRQIGKWGILPSNLFRPKGIAINNQSSIYVSDSYTGTIQAFDKHGNYIGILGKTKSDFLKLTTPVGMAFDTKGRLYVVQMTLNKVSIFKIYE